MTTYSNELHALLLTFSFLLSMVSISFSKLHIRMVFLSSCQKDSKDSTVIEISTIVASGERGSHSYRGWSSEWSGSPWWLYCKKMDNTQDNCFSFHGLESKLFM